MKITIDTDVLARYKLTFGEFLALLFPYFEYAYDSNADRLEEVNLAMRNKYDRTFLVISNETKDLIARILTESDPKLEKSPIKDFEALAKKLMEIYPEGNKEGTTYPWRGIEEEIAQKLRVLVVQHDFIYTEEEAINATKQYVDSFKDDSTHMKLLKYFIIRTKDREIRSDFMTIIENNRNENNNR